MFCTELSHMGNAVINSTVERFSMHNIDEGGEQLDEISNVVRSVKHVVDVE